MWTRATRVVAKAGHCFSKFRRRQHNCILKYMFHKSSSMRLTQQILLKLRTINHPSLPFYYQGCMNLRLWTDFLNHASIRCILPSLRRCCVIDMLKVTQVACLLWINKHIIWLVLADASIKVFLTQVGRTTPTRHSRELCSYGIRFCPGLKNLKCNW